ncbi:MAG: phage tail family protein [Oscillospiraceae bacterium]|nr:phage tail family protein [Oscillospiraceae bacterium]
MSYRLILSSEGGGEVDLYNDSDIRLVSIDGVSPEAVVNTVSRYGADGATYISSKVDKRDIAITCRYRSAAAELAKLRLYEVCRPKRVVTLRYITNNLDRYIEGYISSCSTPPNVHPMLTQIQLECPEPYWRDYTSSSMLLYGDSALFEFPDTGKEFIDNEVEFGNLKTSRITTITYEGDTDVGITLSVGFNAACGGFTLVNLDTGEYLTVTAEFLSGDKLTLCTVNGGKYATLRRNGVDYDYLAKISIDSTFLQLSPGENRLKIIADDITATGINVLCYYNLLYGGV